MSKQIIVNSCLNETRVALLEEGQMTEYYVERKNEAGITGNIYIGRVTKVLPGMQACFVNIGQARDAFLYSSDIFDNLKDPESVVEEEEEGLDQLDGVQLGGDYQSGQLNGSDERLPEKLKEEPEIIIQSADRVNSADLNDMEDCRKNQEEQGADGEDAEDAEDAEEGVELSCKAEEEPELIIKVADKFLEKDSRAPEAGLESGSVALADSEAVTKRKKEDRKSAAFKRKPPRRRRYRGKKRGSDRTRRVPIEELVRKNQEVMVQVGKDSTGNKGARVTSVISLPGRFLVYMPHSSKVRISRRIEKVGERNRLKKIMGELAPATGGFIVRTAAENKTKEDFQADINFLISTWEDVLAKVERAKAPCILHKDLDLILKTARDLLTPDVKRMIIDDQREFERCREFTKQYMERMTDRVKFFNRREPIFERYNVEQQIEKALRRKVWLKSGGYLVVDEAEALVAIDVNSGKYVGKSNLEDTVFKINLEAVQESARQMKIRNLSGIIIIDLIDMEIEENRNKVMETLKRHLKADRVRTNIHQLSDLGIVEMTRKRSRVSLAKKLLRDCPYCSGSGKVKSQISVFSMIYREIAKLSRKNKGSDFLIRTHPDIADLFYDRKEELLLQLQRSCKRKVFIKSDHTMRYDQYDILTV